MKKYIIILFLFPLSAVFSGCKSADAKMEKGRTNITVSHEVLYSNKGTKSEGRSGYLKINGIVVPDCFTAVVADGKLYTFRSRNTMWGDDGYFPLENGSVESVYPHVNTKISDSDINMGWSRVSGHCLNVPSHWIFVKWLSGSAALSPDKVDLLIKSESIGTIERNRMFSEMTLKK